MRWKSPNLTASSSSGSPSMLTSASSQREAHAARCSARRSVEADVCRALQPGDRRRLLGAAVGVPDEEGQPLDDAAPRRHALLLHGRGCDRATGIRAHLGRRPRPQLSTRERAVRGRWDQRAADVQPLRGALGAQCEAPGPRQGGEPQRPQRDRRGRLLAVEHPAAQVEGAPVAPLVQALQSGAAPSSPVPRAAPGDRSESSKTPPASTRGSTPSASSSRTPRVPKRVSATVSSAWWARRCAGSSPDTVIVHAGSSSMLGTTPAARRSAWSASSATQASAAPCIQRIDGGRPAGRCGRTDTTTARAALAGRAIADSQPTTSTSPEPIPRRPSCSVSCATSRRRDRAPATTTSTPRSRSRWTTLVEGRAVQQPARCRPAGWTHHDALEEDVGRAGPGGRTPARASAAAARQVGEHDVGPAVRQRLGHARDGRPRRPARSRRPGRPAPRRLRPRRRSPSRARPPAARPP